MSSILSLFFLSIISYSFMSLLVMIVFVNIQQWPVCEWYKSSLQCTFTLHFHTPLPWHLWDRKYRWLLQICTNIWWYRDSWLETVYDSRCVSWIYWVSSSLHILSPRSTFVCQNLINSCRFLSISYRLFMQYSPYITVDTWCYMNFIPELYGSETFIIDSM